MYSKTLLFLVGVAATVSTASARCNADNCLRAIRATSRLPLASTDCASLLDFTVTPSTVTLTEYSTTPQTDTVTIPTTVISTLHDTFTTIVHATSTVVSSATVTASAVPAKRDASDGIPAYASPCSGLVRFSSACSCIGVTAKTVTAVTPSTTVTLPVTSTSLTSITQAVTTSSTTVEDTTVTQTTTDTTFTSVAVTTVSPVSQSITGRLSFTTNGQQYYIGNYDSSGISYAFAVTDPAAAITVTLDANGQLKYGTKVAKGNPTSPGSALQFFFVEPNVATTTRTPYTCSINANHALSCYVNSPSEDLVLSLRPNNFIYSSSRVAAVTNSYLVISPVLS
ncbi:hypothetical protein DL546_004996 [Coniochaeta pulveracea]|uniref:Uncharacterized protein n=1 Tax=Coniochaeta pulveracea TaxID=177199 RepID=A0A420Y7C2_9PEZI|nr:hypothetical protein DL546_004996 [Coniochaeta pulveracea]